MWTRVFLNSVCYPLELMLYSATEVMPWLQDILEVQPGKILLWLLRDKAITLELYVIANGVFIKVELLRISWM